MNIQSEIRDYILTHDFVMLPGIGAFLAEYSKPFLDAQGNIVPPERKIRFNPHLRNDSDVEILQIFRGRLGISNEEVQNQYFSFLDKVESQIEATNRYYWDGFGVLLKDLPNSPLQFIPIQQAAPVVAEQPAISTISEEIPVTEKIVVEEDEPYVYHKPEKKNSGIGKFLIFALPLLLLSVALFYTVFFKPSGTKEVKEPLTTTEPEMEEGVVIDTLYQEPVEATVKPQQQAVQKVEETAVKQHVVRVGIYKRTIDADKIATFLAENGYPARVRPYGPLFKVYLVANSESQALQYIDEVEQLVNDRPVYERP